MAGLTSFHYDLTASTSALSLRAREAFISADQLRVGFDFPMMPDTTIAPARSNLAATDLFDAAAEHEISRGNPLSLFPRLRGRLETHQGSQRAGHDSMPRTPIHRTHVQTFCETPAELL